MKANYDFSKGRRGAVVPTPENKIRITIRLDKDVLEWFRAKVVAACGGNYQTLINDALRDHMKNQGESIEDMLRRVVREELTGAKASGLPTDAQECSEPYAKRNFNSIREMCYTLFDELGPKNVTADQCLALARKIKPNTKFNRSHFYFHRKNWKERKALESGAKITARRAA